MKKYFIITLLLISSFNVQATHLMGGEITWTCIKTGNKAGMYVFQVTVYRDCQGVPIVTSMNLDVHNIPGLNTIPLNWISGTDISPLCDTLDGPNNPFSCNGLNQGMSTSDPGAVEEHIYRSDTIRILGTPDSNGWHFTWSSCCRNAAINNLIITGGSNPQEGFTLRAVMYPYLDSTGTVFPNNNNCYDSSPKFYEKPRTILEVGNGYDPLAFSNGFTYSHNAFDSEQDSIVYDWGYPLNSTGYNYLNPNSTALPFNTSVFPYSFDNPINGIVMNQQTGRTYYPADVQGNYVTCTNVSAYKCGQLVAEIFREIQVVLVPYTCNLGDTTNGNIGADTLCNVRPLVQPPFFYPATPAPFRWDTMVHCGDTVSFDFIANDYDYYPNGSQQDLKFEVSGGQFMDYNVSPPALCQNPPCATFEELGTGAVPPFITSGGTGTGYFEWFTSCNHVINTCGGGLRPSLYTFVIKVQDDFCPAPAIENTSQVISIYVCPPCNLMKGNPTSTPATCAANNGTISVNPSGGFPPYNASYFDMAGVPVNPDSLYSGTYQVRVVDSSQCVSIDTITVSQIVTQLSIDSSLTVITDSICYNTSSGSINITPFGGTAPYSFIWSNGSTLEDISGVGPGNYSVIISDAFSCSSPLISYDIFAYNQINNTSTSTYILCYGDATGSIDITPSGGNPPYSFMWNNGEVTEDISNIISGTYYVQIIDVNTCILSDTVIVSEATAIQISLSANNNITGVANGGTPPYTYDFYNPMGVLIASSTNNMGTSFTINPVTSGQYLMIVTDNNGCLDSSTVTFSTNFSPSVDVTLSNTLCDSLTDLTIMVGQDSSEVDMSTALFQSNAGSFDIASMNVGDTIGTSVMMAGGGTINLNTYLVVSAIITPNDAIIQSIDSVSGTLGTFTISNQATGGINIIANSIPDGNNYTSGNSSLVTFDNVFVNPCVPLVFTFTINSELGDVYTDTVNFVISSLNQESHTVFSVYPNPASHSLYVSFYETIKEVNIKIVDVIGKNIFYEQKRFNIIKHEISISELSEGSYIIIIEINNIPHSKLFIVQ